MSVSDGTVIGGRYVISGVVGRGGMADVYRGTDQVLGRDVALKVLRSTSADETERARFAGEARTLASLNHPGLVTVLDAGIVDEQPYLVMELIEGPTLRQRINDGGPLDPAEVESLGALLADALAYAHDHGVVHRDVKPSNILLRADGRSVLTDFGIARLVSDSGQHTSTGDIIGSPAYLSPEQVNGQPLTTAIDVYSLGLVLLEALTGMRAYPGAPVEAAIARLTARPAIPVSLDHTWRSLLDEMTRLNPTERPTALEVAAVLYSTTPGPAVASRISESTGLLAGAAAVADRLPESGTVATQGLLLTDVPAARRRRGRILVAATVLAAAGLLTAVGLSQFGAAPVVADPNPTVPASTSIPTPTSTPTSTPKAPSKVAPIATRPAPTAKAPASRTPAKATTSGKAPAPGKGSSPGKAGKGKGRGSK